MNRIAITPLFYKMIAHPRLRRILWRLVYEFLACRMPAPDWQFMNYGYAALDGEAALPLRVGDEGNRYSIQLYHHLASKAQLAGADVLEVGSGRGGGASYLMRYLGPRRVVGVELAAGAVRFARRRHRAKGLSFLHGDAERLPCGDGSFDVVINVESCHAYGNLPRFLGEVRRVLRDGGAFLCADLRDAQEMRAFHSELRDSGMELVEAADITPNVVAALERSEPAKREQIRRIVPHWARAVIGQFAGLRGSSSHALLSSRAMVYHAFILRKSAAIGGRRPVQFLCPAQLQCLLPA
jgi:ubiquinone/menaquinone biosynthesis C-methylase UbiE